MVLLLQFLLAINWAYTEINVGRGSKICAKPNIFFVPPLRASREGGQNLNCKFKTFGFLDTLKVHVQLPFKDYLISPWDKTSRKKQQINLFNTLHFQFQIWKVMIALRGMGHCPPPVLCIRPCLQCYSDNWKTME